MFPVRRALLSVSDKRGLAELGRGLARLNIEILSTGGTQRYLAEHDIEVIPVAKVTGSPEILNGRVKTLHPKIHGGILADRSRSEHLKELKEQEIAPIDLVVVNLYPFARTVSRDGVSREEAVDMIDIGGPCMLRAAAKNHGSVTVVVDPDDYGRVLRAIEAGDGLVPEALRRELAIKAFRHTHEYDGAIVAWLEAQEELRRELAIKAFRHTHEYDGAIVAWLEAQEEGEEEAATFPERFTVDLERRMVPRYGENPHQESAIYRTVGGSGVLGGFHQHQGKELSYNNLLDADAARKMVSQFEETAVVIVKHNNPCGVGLGKDLVEAYRAGLATDPQSAFGSIIALNRPATAKLAEAMRDLFVEVVIAPGFEDGARAVYDEKKNLRLIETPLYLPGRKEPELRSIDGGFLAQTADSTADDPGTWQVRTAREPTDEQLEALELAWKVCRYTKSNAIVLANSSQTVGVGAGQMSRVDACRIAIEKAAQAGLSVEGAVAASDAFFPFSDNVEVLAGAGVRAIVQPGGSKRDPEVLAAADELGIAMVLTGTRHFRH